VNGLEKQEAAAGLHPDDGQTGTPTGGTIMNNVKATVTDAPDMKAVPTTEATDTARANQHATSIVAITGFNPNGFIDKNEGGIWHVVLREEPTHPIPTMRAVLMARPESYWSEEFTTRGRCWGHDPEALHPDEFRFTYIDRYELTDTFVSTRTGEWTGVFRQLTKVA
jgi:hypothetical protein